VLDDFGGERFIQNNGVRRNEHMRGATLLERGGWKGKNIGRMAHVK